MIVEMSKWTPGKSHIERLPVSRKAHPASVWLYYSTKAAAVAALSQSIFQRPLADDEYVKLVDAQMGDSVRICTSHFEHSPGCFISMIRIKLYRAIKIGNWSGRVNVEYGITHDGNTPQLLLLNFHVPQEAQKKGVATHMFAAHVHAAQTFGFPLIHAYAVGGSGSEAWDTRNGYYTWPRLGF